MRARLTTGAVGLGATVVLAGCGSSAGDSYGGSTPTTGSGASSSSATSSTATSSTAASSSVSGSATKAGSTVTVKATEYAFALPDTHLAPGTYTFQLANDGRASHAMTIQGPGISGQKSSNVSPGGMSTMSVNLQPGTYTLWCPVDNHRSEGMQTTLTVG